MANCYSDDELHSNQNNVNHDVPEPALEVKKQLTFYKVNYFKYCFYDTSYSQCFKIFYGLATTFLHIFLKKGNKVKKILRPLAIITKRSILEVAAVLDPPLVQRIQFK